MKEFFAEHKWLVVCVSTAIIVGVMLLTLGFWRTLLLTVLISIGTFFGIMLDKGGAQAVSDFFKNLFGKGNV
ncbi:MAG TPA: DUF2273 domain-containing protein [Eubacteriales bacterium]|nr:DUF2273 domain-containing protein [Clostridia bacterium]HRV72585.1 DUF2273 domain-containing protein [Eubacteriales bacterium]